MASLSDELELEYGYRLRSPEQVAGFLDGFEFVGSAVVSSSPWQPEPDPSDPQIAVDEFCCVRWKR